MGQAGILEEHERIEPLAGELVAGNPDSPQAVASITDVMGILKRIAYTITPYTTVIRRLA